MLSLVLTNQMDWARERSRNWAFGAAYGEARISLYRDCSILMGLIMYSFQTVRRGLLLRVTTDTCAPQLGARASIRGIKASPSRATG